MAVKHNSIVSARTGNISATIFTDLQNLLENDEALDATLKQVETNAAAIQACMNGCSLSMRRELQGCLHKLYKQLRWELYWRMFFWMR